MSYSLGSKGFGSLAIRFPVAKQAASQPASQQVKSDMPPRQAPGLLERRMFDHSERSTILFCVASGFFVFVTVCLLSVLAVLPGHQRPLPFPLS